MASEAVPEVASEAVSGAVSEDGVRGGVDAENVDVLAAAAASRPAALKPTAVPITPRPSCESPTPTRSLAHPALDTSLGLAVPVPPAAAVARCESPTPARSLACPAPDASSGPTVPIEVSVAGLAMPREVSEAGSAMPRVPGREARS
jgi:hypothetical protein